MQYISNFIGEDEEQTLLSIIDANIWSNDLTRRTQHYGYKYNYTDKKIDPSMSLGPIPEWLDVYCERVAKFFPRKPDQVIINEYMPGQGLGGHVDTVTSFGPVIASLSLNSTCGMDFEEVSTGKSGCTVLEPRSLLVLAEDARYKWRHGITARLQDPLGDQVLTRKRRVSLTFRTILT